MDRTNTISMRRIRMVSQHLFGVIEPKEPRCNCSRCRRARGLFDGDAEDGPCTATFRSLVSSSVCRGEKNTEFTLQELREFDGTNGKPVYIALKGQVFDVSAGPYGPGGGYSFLAGKDASRALAKMSRDPADASSSNLSDLSDRQRETLDKWSERMLEKYPLVGTLV